MTTQVYVAIIAAAGALLVAVVSGLLQIKRERELKKLEAEIRERERLRVAQLEQVDARRASCARACQAIQRFRDTITLIVGGNGAMLTRVAKDRLESARDSVAGSYEDALIRLLPDDRLLMHSAKNRVLEVSAMLDRSGVWGERMLQLNHETVQQLLESRAVLAEVQQIILLASLSAEFEPLDTSHDQ